MTSVSISDLRNHGGDVLSLVERGESMIVTRDGSAVAELRPLPKPSPSAAELIARRRSLPIVDPVTLSADLDSVVQSAP